MFQFLASFARLRRSDTSLFLVAALLALWALPLAGQNTFAPNTQSYEAVLLLLSAEANAPQTLHLGAATLLETRAKPGEDILASKATAHCGAFRPASSPTTPPTIRARRTHDLSASVIARLSGIQTNVRLN